jgi:hypothetical protein
MTVLRDMRKVIGVRRICAMRAGMGFLQPMTG